MPSQTETEYTITPQQIDQYRRDGFVKLEDVFTGDDLAALRDAVAGAVAQENAGDTRPAEEKASYEQLFIQKVNLWQRHPSIARFVTCARIGNLAAKLEGRDMRLWHDHALFKEPVGGNRTPWHQDAPYWPHTDRMHSLSIWIALRDATVQNGCMAFIPGTHKKEYRWIDLGANDDIFEQAPEFKGTKPVVNELKAGSATFHNGLTFHYAGPNKSKATREAIAILFMPADQRYTGAAHVVTDPLGLKAGDALNDELIFPLVGRV